MRMKITPIVTLASERRYNLAMLGLLVILNSTGFPAKAASEPGDETEISIKEFTTEHEMDLPNGVRKKDTLSVTNYMRDGTLVASYRVVETTFIQSDRELRRLGKNPMFFLHSPGGLRISVAPGSGHIISIKATIPLYVNVVLPIDEASPVRVEFAVPADEVFEIIDFWPDGTIQLADGEEYASNRTFLIEVAAVAHDGLEISHPSEDNE